MNKRNALLSAARRASEVISAFNVKNRIVDGYTRIDPALIASEENVTVMYRSLDRLLGGFLREEGASGIIVNVARPRGLVHMTCAHELGHYFMGHESVMDETVDHGAKANLIEQQANHFAYSLLAPQWLIVSTMKPKKWVRSDLSNPAIVYQLSLRLGTSFTAMVWSLSRLNLIANDEAERLIACKPKDLKKAAMEGCVQADANADVWLLDPSDRDHILEPAYGDQFLFDLPNHAGSGHLWSIDELRSEGFTLKPFVRDARTQTPTDAKKVIVGGGRETTRYTLHNQPTAGAAMDTAVGNLLTSKRQVIAVKETLPWLQHQTPNDMFSISTEIESMRDGFSVAEREKRLALAREAR